MKKFALCFLFIGLLLGSFFWPALETLWQTLDIAVFKFFNGTLEGSRSLQTFWALINHKKADLVEDAVFLTFFIVAIASAPRSERLRRTAQFIFTILVAGSIIYFVNRIFLREHILIPRMSPSLVVTPCVRVSQELPWLLVKDETLASFPGDHATTLILFATFYTFFAGWRLGKYACLYAVFRMLPRLVLGAHWLSDIIVGSGSLVLFFVALTLCTPFHHWIIAGIERGLLICKNGWFILKKKYVFMGGKGSPGECGIVKACDTSVRKATDADNPFMGLAKEGNEASDCPPSPGDPLPPVNTYKTKRSHEV